MKRTRVLGGLAVLSVCLAVGSASWVFGQPDLTGLVPPPTPVAPTAPAPGGPQPSGPLLPGDSGPVQAQPAAPPMPPPPPALAGPSSGLTLTGPSQPGGARPPAAPARVPINDQIGPLSGAGSPARSPVQPVRYDAVPPERGPEPVADAVPGGRQEPAVSLEWVGPTTARLHQPTNYQLVAKNVSTTPVHNVQVRYPVPAGVRVVGSEPRPAGDGSVLSWDLGGL